MWSPYTAHQYVVSVIRCWYGQVPHSCHAEFAEHAVYAAVVVPIGGSAPVGAVGAESAGEAPTAWPSERPGAIETTAPGSEAAASASCALTGRVDEPLETAAGEAASAWACAGAASSGAAGCGPPAAAAGTRTTVARPTARPRTDARQCLCIAPSWVVWTMSRGYRCQF